MNYLVVGLAVLYVAAHCEATIFSWGGSSTEVKEPKPAGYLPLLKIRKYNGIQIDPIQGAPIYLPNEPDSNNLQGQTTQLSQDQIQQLNLINRLATFLPSEDNLQEMDLSAALPYVDLISEESLESFKNTIEATKPKEKSKLLKFIGFLKYLKEKKLKPFKYVASLGSNIVTKKKNWLGLGGSTTTPEPFTETPPMTYPPYYGYNPYPAPPKPLFTSYSTSAPIPSPAPLPPISYYPQYPIYSFNTQQKNTDTPSLPSADQFPPNYFQITQQKQPAETPAELPSLPKAPAPPQFQFPASFQSQGLPLNQYQPSSFAPAQPEFKFPYQSAQPADPAKNEVTYEYKQPPASTYAIQDTNAIRQFASSIQSELPSTSAPKIEQNEQQYPYQSNQISSYSPPQQLPTLPKFQPNSWYIYPNANQEPNKFYTASPNDLAAAGSENVEKIEEREKPENSLKNDLESTKVNNAVTSTEISVSKSQQASPKRTALRAIAAPNRTTAFPVYPSLPKEENLKDDSNKSSPLPTAPTTN